MKRIFDHIDLRVKDRAVAQQFYGRLLPALGFTTEASADEWGVFYAGKPGPVEFFGFIEDRRHQPNESRIAFWAESRAEVDRLTEVVRQAGGQNLEGPQVWTEYHPGYYALFFDDPSGNRLEICHRMRPPIAE
jgi:predicted lactoylglutathione lyase